jgi:PPOX class probable F420-dependent enzyme
MHRAFLSDRTRTAKVASSRSGGQPRVMPVWFVLDGEELVFTTWGESVTGRNLRRNPRATVVVDEEIAPDAFVHIVGHVTLSEDLEALLRFATAIRGGTWPLTEQRSLAAEMPCRASCSFGSDRSA